MSEILLVRVGQSSEDEITWLVYSQKDKSIIASGDIDGALQLEQLEETAHNRKVALLLPAGKVQLRQVELPTKWNRKLANALPFMLEEDLACDIDDVLIFHGDTTEVDTKPAINVAITEREWFESWLTLFANHQIKLDIAVPDALLLPTPEEDEVSAIEINGNWLFKSNQWQIAEVQNSWLDLYLATFNDEAISHYSPCEFVEIDLIEKLSAYDLPLAIFAQNISGTKFNLLQGDYAVKKQSSGRWLTWRAPAIAASVALLFSIGLKGIHAFQLEQQVAVAKQQVIKTYKKAYPKSKVRPHLLRSELRKQVEALESGGDTGFLSLLQNLGPVLKEVGDFDPQALRYDAKRKELRLRAKGKDFQSFNQVKQRLEALELVVEQGALNNDDNAVVGELKIKGKV